MYSFCSYVGVGVGVCASLETGYDYISNIFV